MSRKSIAIVAVLFVVVAALVVSGVATAKRPAPGPLPGDCPWSGMSCPDVYDPVTCDNGVTYPNACYAFIDCATGCSGGGASQ